MTSQKIKKAFCDLFLENPCIRMSNTERATPANCFCIIRTRFAGGNIGRPDICPHLRVEIDAN